MICSKFFWSRQAVNANKNYNVTTKKNRCDRECFFFSNDLKHCIRRRIAYVTDRLYYYVAADLNQNSFYTLNKLLIVAHNKQPTVTARVQTRWRYGSSTTKKKSNLEKKLMIELSWNHFYFGWSSSNKYYSSIQLLWRIYADISFLNC